MNDPILINEMIDVLKKASMVALFSHVSPDGDCVGSMLALGLTLEKIGKKVYIYNPDPIPDYLRFLPGSARINHELPNPLPGVLLFVDCTDIQRVNLSMSQIPRECIVFNIDHHISNQRFGDFNLIEPQASASAEVVYNFIKEMGSNIDQDIAVNLYTAIVTDSGCFQYGSTTAQTHRLTAELLDLGLDLPMIHHNIFDQKSLAQIKLLQCALSSLEVRDNGQLAVMHLSTEDFIKSGAKQELSEGLVNHARSIAGVEVAVLLKETGPCEIKVGLRSNLWLNVNEIAARFGGGGHKRAAGCTLKMPLLEARQIIIKAIAEDLRRGRTC